MDGPINRRSHTGTYEISPEGYPLCPTGRTGACMRNRLGRWGPNHAADPIVTRWTTAENDASGKKILSVALIRREDIGCWATPGGMVDAGEDPKDTASREFLEEAMSILQVSREEGAAIESKLQNLFKNGVKVWSGVVGDSRNSDNAWMESVAYHFHDDDGVLDDVQLKAGDDAIGAAWFNVDKRLEHVLGLGTHTEQIRKAADRLKIHF